MRIRVSILGVTGYTGGELLRLLLKHPKVQIAHLASESRAGIPVSSVHQDLAGVCDRVLERPWDVLSKDTPRDTEVFFLALPAGRAFEAVLQILKLGKKVIDLSADFRLKDAQEFERWYKLPHGAKRVLQEAVYGLPELKTPVIKRARIVANPGCYATAVILGVAPLLKGGLVHPSFVADAKSGVSGAGKKIEFRYHYVEVTENFSAYAVAHHRHMPEMEQALKNLSGQKVQVTFVPHLLPMSRGILSACYLKLWKRASAKKLLTVYQKFYQKSPFVRVRMDGSFPEIKHVARTNFCDIGLTVDERTGTAIVISAIDNLVKGAAGQAVQNMNIMMGLEETTGLLR